MASSQASEREHDARLLVPRDTAGEDLVRAEAGPSAVIGGHLGERLRRGGEVMHQGLVPVAVGEERSVTGCQPRLRIRTSISG